MADNLSIVTSDLLTDVSEKEVNELIEDLIEKSQNNMNEICELTLECTTLLSSNESRIEVLEEQSGFGRLIGNITGKNRKLQNAILQNHTNALYVAQEVINRVMNECVNNRQMFVAINDKVNDLFLELKESQQDVAGLVGKNRQALANFYDKYKRKIEQQEGRLSQIEEYAKLRCPNCQNELFSWQKVCNKCGTIHPLKIKEIKSNHSKDMLSKISDIVKDKSLSEDIVWNETVQKKDRVLRKIKNLAKMGVVPDFTSEMESDIDDLIRKCKNAEFQIAVVGVMKAGKSFLMNALIGAEIASVEVNPETAALTKFRSSNGFYVIVRFHDKVHWIELKKSVNQGKKEGKGSFAVRLKNPAIVKMESEWIGHDEIVINCSNLAELQNTVKKYTSSQTIEHIFVSEVEVGVDRSIFNMPDEVVFVDTPGLKDPVKYRSDITRNYIKKADAVLIALKPGPLTTEGVEIVTTVLDCTETDKAYIIGTQKDLNKEEECEKYKSNWIEHLVKAKRYKDKREATGKIILTSAKMELLINRWRGLSDKEKSDESCFDENDYFDLENFTKKTLKLNKRASYDLTQITTDECNTVSRATGIPTLRDKLDENLIKNYRRLKLDDIEKTFIRCRQQIMKLCEDTMKEENNSIQTAEAGAEAIKKQIDVKNLEKMQMKQDNEELQRNVQKLEGIIRRKIEKLERQEG